MGDHSPLSSFHRDIGIPINFQEESGLGPFRNNELGGPLEVLVESWFTSSFKDRESDLILG